MPLTVPISSKLASTTAFSEKNVARNAKWIGTCAVKIILASREKNSFACEQKSVLLPAKWEKVDKFNRFDQVQPSIFRKNNFARRIWLSWDQAWSKIVLNAFFRKYAKKMYSQKNFFHFYPIRVYLDRRVIEGSLERKEKWYALIDNSNIEDNHSICFSVEQRFFPIRAGSCCQWLPYSKYAAVYEHCMCGRPSSAQKL